MADLPKQSEPMVAVSIRQVNHLTPITSRGDVEQAAGDLDAQGS